MDNALTDLKQGRAGYDEAVREIAAGRAKPRNLWVLLSAESQRDGYALKPAPWEGPGEYQFVEFMNNSWRLVRLPENAKRLSSIAGAA